MRGLSGTVTRPDCSPGVLAYTPALPTPPEWFMSKPGRTLFFIMLLTLPLFAAPGCVQRTLQVESDPPGALVYLNGEEAGRTPMRKNFVWYGTYDVQLRKEGYHTLSRETKVWAPWWQWPPIDL